MIFEIPDLTPAQLELLKRCQRRVRSGSDMSFTPRYDYLVATDPSVDQDDLDTLRHLDLITIEKPVPRNMSLLQNTYYAELLISSSTDRPPNAIDVTPGGHYVLDATYRQNKIVVNRKGSWYEFSPIDPPGRVAYFVHELTIDRNIEGRAYFFVWWGEDWVPLVLDKLPQIQVADQGEGTLYVQIDYHYNPHDIYLWIQKTLSQELQIRGLHPEPVEDVWKNLSERKSKDVNHVDIG